MGVEKAYFDDLFMEHHGIYSSVIDNVLCVVSADDNVKLIKPFSLEEFRTIIFQMHPNKAPGSDGLNPAFYQHFWEDCGVDVYHSCCKWLNSGTFPPSLNDTNVVLIPNVSSPDSIRDLGPISLCNVV